MNTLTTNAIIGASRRVGRKIKISDVAREAGVSPSTVDRVLNARAGVREKTILAVEGAMTRLGYSTNALSARIGGSLSQIDVALPRGKNPFFLAIRAEIERLAMPMVTLGTKLRIIEMDVFDTSSAMTFLNHYDGAPGRVLVLVAHETPEVRQGIDLLVAGGTPVITLISDSVQSRRNAFVGIDNFAAGRTAGALMARFIGTQQGRIGIMVGSLALRDHLDRRSGFEQSFSQMQPLSDVQLIGSSQEEDPRAEALVENALRRYPDMIGLYNVGAAGEGMFRAIRASGRADLHVIAHEHVAENRAAVLGGLCDALIVQDVTEAARRALDAAMALGSATGTPNWQGQMQIGILIKENLP